jgi:hypothetical protein
MIGATWLPPHKDHDGDLCIQQAGQVPHRVGEYIRRCNYCRHVFIAVVTVAFQSTVDKCGGSEVLHIGWLDADREPVT